MDLVFHNAYGPDKAWFYDYALSGGGCVIDLGIHLVDLLFWTLGASNVSEVTSHLFSGGARLGRPVDSVEDYASASICLEPSATARLACSWKLQAGCDAIISATFHGTHGGVEFRNVNGSFYEFKAERFRATTRELLASGAEDWGGRAAVDWARRLWLGQKFDPDIERMMDVARTLDRIYGRE